MAEPPFTTERVRSTRNVDLALHHFGGSGPRLVICHATGFHAQCYLPMMPHLLPHFTVYGLDFAGHGASTAPEGDDYAWEGFADDLLAVVDHLGGESIKAFGHSMGGAAILIAERERPGTITDAWMFEPIIVPPAIERKNSMMSDRAVNRRRLFPSRAEALHRYASRPPLGIMRADALAAYVEYGFHDADDGVTLACAPEAEGAIFNSAHTTAEDIPGLMLNAVVACGTAPEEPNPASFAPRIAEVLSNSRLERFEGLGHFGPMQDPDRIGSHVASFLR